MMSKQTNVEKTDWAAVDLLDEKLDGQLDGVHLPVLKAVLAVESRGQGFLSNGKPKILFEGHQFYKRLKLAGYNPNTYRKGNEDILYRKWTRKHYVGGAGEYGRLARAMKINEEVALQCASYGIAQIMGFNYKTCGFSTVHEFVEAMNDHDSQIAAFIGFLKSGLWKHIKGDKPNWRAFAKAYNGKLYYKNDYHGKLARAYLRYSTDPQQNFKPLYKSRTMQGGVTAATSTTALGATAYTMVSEVMAKINEISQVTKGSVTDAKGTIEATTQSIEALQGLIDNVVLAGAGGGALTLIGVAYLIYARWDDRQKGRN